MTNAPPNEIDTPPGSVKGSPAVAASRPHERPTETCWRSRRAWTLLLFITIGALVSDLGSKWLAFEKLGPAPVRLQREDVLQTDQLWTLIPDPPRRVVIPHVLDLTLVLNPGAVFGIGAGKRVFFVAFTLGAVLFSIWMFGAWTTPRDRIAHIAIGLILGGGLGNLYDRLVYACVRDFLHPLPNATLPFGWQWPWGGREVWPYVSNIADLWLLIGIGALLVILLKASPPHGPRAAQPVK